MRIRRLAACGLVLSVVTASAAQTPDRPSELPPLLPVPPAAAPAPAPGRRGPAGEYDPGYFYLPERAPDAAAAEPPCGPPGRFWVVPALQLGWTRGAHVPPLVLGGVRVSGGVIPGTVLYGGGSLPAP